MHGSCVCNFELWGVSVLYGFPYSINAMMRSSSVHVRGGKRMHGSKPLIHKYLSCSPCGCACSEDGRLNCGYSSIRGRRATMEDFYDIKSSRIGDKQINFFGVFDGQAFPS